VEGTFSAFRLDVFVRVVRDKLLRMHDLGWHAQHRRAALCGYATPSCFVAGAFPDYCCMGINMPGDTFTHLTDPRLRQAVTISLKGGSAYECMKQE